MEELDADIFPSGLVALKNVLPDCHYRCWYILFVEACHLICSRTKAYQSWTNYLLSFACVLKLPMVLRHAHRIYTFMVTLKNVLLTMALLAPFDSLLLKGSMGF